MFPKNENKTDEMVDIVSHLHQYIPKKSYTEEKLLSTGEFVELEQTSFHRILLGGDQLTAARVRGAQASKQNAETPSKKLKGVVAAVEDWHTKANFMGVSMY